MNARSRQARRTIAARTRTQRAQARIARRNAGSLTTHGIAAGLTVKDAASMAGSLRTVAKRLGIQGTSARVHRAGRMRDTTRFTPAQIAALCTAYKPRRADFKAAKERLLHAVPATRRSSYTAAA